MGLLTSLLRMLHPIRTTKRAVRRAVVPRPIRKAVRIEKTMMHPIASAEGLVKYKAIGALDRASTPKKRPNVPAPVDRADDPARPQPRIQEQGSLPADRDRKMDPLFARSARMVAADHTASASQVQRKFHIDYSRSARIVELLAEHGVIGAYQGSKSREVLMTLPEVDELLERLGIE